MVNKKMPTIISALWVEGDIPASSAYTSTGKKERIAAPLRVQAFHNKKSNRDKNQTKKTNATVAEVLEALPDPPSYSAVRALLRILEIKGHVKHRSEGPRYVFSPVVSREKAKRSALEHLLNTFFNGSTEKAVATLIDVSKDDLSAEELDRLSMLINEVKKEGR